MKTTVIYHSADMDGIFCREIARKFLPPDTEFIGWNFGDPALIVPDPPFYVMDLPLDRPFGYDFQKSAELLGSTATADYVRLKKAVWIDHHKSSIESHPSDIPGYRIDGVAACRLAWQWFIRGSCHNPGPNLGVGMPQREDFSDRTVFEPLSVQLAGEYDVWDHRGDGDLEFQFGMRAESEPVWPMLLSENNGYTDAIVKQGKVCMAYAKNVDASIVNTRSYVMEWEGLRWLTMNIIRCNSQSFEAKDIPETGHDALLAFYYNGKTWTVSLYHARHRTDLDLSKIAVKYGGGGHKGACGFTTATLPWPMAQER